jgi:hypothetical protein
MGHCYLKSHKKKRFSILDENYTVCELRNNALLGEYRKEKDRKNKKPLVVISSERTDYQRWED